MCDPSKTLERKWRYSLFDSRLNCQNYIAAAAKCLAQGRDVTVCCEKMATDERDKYCFGICNGTMDHYDSSMMHQLAFCFSKNIDAVYQCLMAGYLAAPTPPQNVTLVSKNENSADINWKEPAEGVDLVEYYSIHIITRTGEFETKESFTTKHKSFTVEGLIPEVAYVVYVVAHAAGFNNDTNWYKSRLSNVVRFNLKEQLVVSKKEIFMPKSTETLTMFCKLRPMLEAGKSVDWVKVIGNESELLVSRRKYSIRTYQPKERPVNGIIYSTLEITDFDESNFASYRCYINNTRVEYYETAVTELDYSEQAPADSPPESLLECCARNIQKERCQTFCTDTDRQTLEKLRVDQLVGAIVPRNMRHCGQEILSIFKCSQDDVFAAACCIHAQIPFHCLGMCDNRFETDWIRVRQCKQYVEKVYQCKYETISVKPSGFGDVGVSHIRDWKFRFKWEKPADTKVFYVYYKRKNGSWKSLVTLDHTIDIVAADEFVLIGVHEFGQSAPYRMKYGLDGWVPVDRY